MFALVESGNITKMMRGNKGITIGDNQYPAAIFTVWTESERNAIGIYTIEIDETNRKNEEWYINTDITYAYDSSAKKVKGTYGTATAKAHADTKWTQSEIDAGNAPAGADTNTVKTEGLKTILIRAIKLQVKSILNETDWYITRKAEKSTAIPSAITTHRDAVRTKQAAMETAITNAADTAALETLHTRDSNGDRPLGDLPTLE
mgnify:CR=1 FL=1|jgi:hypothetical protein|tara:strand:- start:184 stop:795 length:612 start_codon:yes stop_codon:yes gene_type:complete